MSLDLFDAPTPAVTFTDSFASGTGWNAWVRPSKREGAPWRWEATCLGCPAVWMPAPTQAEAELAAIEFVREQAKSTLRRAQLVLESLGEKGEVEG